MHEVTQYASSSGVSIGARRRATDFCGLVGGLWLLFWKPPLEPAERRAAAVARRRDPHPDALHGRGYSRACTDRRQEQCVASVFLGGLVASGLVESSFRSPSGGRWYWIAPLAVGVIGYLLAAVQNPGWAQSVRILDGTLAPLARPLPLDYASAGMFGTLLGYWTNVPEAGEGEEFADLRLKDRAAPCFSI